MVACIHIPTEHWHPASIVNTLTHMVLAPLQYCNGALVPISTTYPILCHLQPSPCFLFSTLSNCKLMSYHVLDVTAKIKGWFTFWKEIEYTQTDISINSTVYILFLNIIASASLYILCDCLQASVHRYLCRALVVQQVLRLRLVPIDPDTEVNSRGGPAFRKVENHQFL